MKKILLLFAFAIGLQPLQIMAEAKSEDKKISKQKIEDIALPLTLIPLGVLGLYLLKKGLDKYNLLRTSKKALSRLELRDDINDDIKGVDKLLDKLIGENISNDLTSIGLIDMQIPKIEEKIADLIKKHGNDSNMVYTEKKKLGELKAKLEEKRSFLEDAREAKASETTVSSELTKSADETLKSENSISRPDLFRRFYEAEDQEFKWAKLRLTKIGDSERMKFLQDIERGSNNLGEKIDIFGDDENSDGINFKTLDEFKTQFKAKMLQAKGEDEVRTVLEEFNLTKDDINRFIKGEVAVDIPGTNEFYTFKDNSIVVEDSLGNEIEVNIEPTFAE